MRGEKTQKLWLEIGNPGRIHPGCFEYTIEGALRKAARLSGIARRQEWAAWGMPWRDDELREWSKRLKLWVRITLARPL